MSESGCHLSKNQQGKLKARLPLVNEIMNQAVQEKFVPKLRRNKLLPDGRGGRDKGWPGRRRRQRVGRAVAVNVWVGAERRKRRRDERRPRGERRAGRRRPVAVDTGRGRLEGRPRSRGGRLVTLARRRDERRPGSRAAANIFRRSQAACT